MIEKFSFTLADYRAILESARAAGYRFLTLTEHDDGPVVYLRHDVDHSVETAHWLAEVEAQESVRSTYLFLVRWQNYNPFNPTNVDRIRAIAALGHEVGLHYGSEVEETATDEDDLRARILADAQLFEHGIGIPVRVFSFHNPAEKSRFRVEVPGLVNSYSPRFFDEAHYVSESNMRWQGGSPVDLLARREYRVVQILVHPLSYRGDFRSDRDVVLRFLSDKVRDLTELNVAQNRSLRASGLTVREVAEHLLQSEEAE